MIFTTFTFLLFFAVAAAVFYLLPSRLRKYWLLLCNLYFYGNTDPNLLLVLAAITLLTYVGGFLIYRFDRSRRLFILFFAALVGILLGYKYIPFFVQSWNQAISAIITRGMVLPVPKIVAPLGISFLIFQSTTYLGDIYRGRMPFGSLVDCALFISFFPTIISGPIQKASALIPQFRFDRNLSEEDLRKGICLMVYGFCAKLFVADPLSFIVNDIFDTYSNYTSLYFWIAAVYFSIQIYADFLSYSEIARGAALIFGIRISKNFNNPYLATSISDFWRNWHMSLNAWFTEYLYFPLGGSRKGVLRTRINKAIVLCCSGLWHGASWNYVLWGVANAAIQWVDDSLKDYKARLFRRLGFSDDSGLLRLLQRAVVFILITTTWVLFRVPSGMDGLYIISRMYRPDVFVQLYDMGIWSVINGEGTWVFLAVCVFVFLKIQIMRKGEDGIYQRLSREPKWVISLLLGICAAFILVSMCGYLAKPNQSFIYFEF